ncbi:hypothetical protein HBH49_190590 [Parastagonospora nodorum]|nr:hypothetical protein HBH49_190590 [Parastagonospora nodorum]
MCIVLKVVIAKIRIPFVELTKSTKLVSSRFHYVFSCNDYLNPLESLRDAGTGSVATPRGDTRPRVVTSILKFPSSRTCASMYDTTAGDKRCRPSQHATQTHRQAKHHRRPYIRPGSAVRTAVAD